MFEISYFFADCGFLLYKVVDSLLFFDKINLKYEYEREIIMALLYCKKCGRIVNAHDKNGRDVQSSECDYCGSSTYPVPKKYWLDGLNFLITNEQKELLREEFLAGTDRGNPYGITCPYCKATNIRKIGIISRSVSAGLFGLGSKKIGKQWHCDHCGSDF